MDQTHVKDKDRNVISFDDFKKKQDKLLKAVEGEPEYGQHEIKAEESYVRHDANIYKAAGIKFQKKDADNENKVDPAVIPNTTGVTNEATNPGFKKLSLADKIKGLMKWAEQFPSDTTSWADATDELPDIHNELADLYNELKDDKNAYKGNIRKNSGGTMPNETRTDPAVRNKTHKEGLKKITSLLQKEFPGNLDDYLDKQFGGEDSWKI